MTNECRKQPHSNHWNMCTPKEQSNHHERMKNRTLIERKMKSTTKNNKITTNVWSSWRRSIPLSNHTHRESNSCRADNQSCKQLQNTNENPADKTKEWEWEWEREQTDVTACTGPASQTLVAKCSGKMTITIALTRKIACSHQTSRSANRCKEKHSKSNSATTTTNSKESEKERRKKKKKNGVFRWISMMFLKKQTSASGTTANEDVQSRMRGKCWGFHCQIALTWEQTNETTSNKSISQSINQSINRKETNNTRRFDWSSQSHWL